MRGEILTFDDVEGHGLISGDDGQRYSFSRSDLLKLALPSPGLRVDFVPAENVATQLIVLEIAGAARTPAVLPPGMPAATPSLDVWGYFVRCITTKYLDATGRAPRSEYWGFVLFTAIFAVVGMALLCIPLAIFASSRPEGEASFSELVILAIAGLGFLAILPPSLCVSIRRLHDLGLTGWLILLRLIPYAGGLFMFVVALIPSQQQINKHGPRPL